MKNFIEKILFLSLLIQSNVLDASCWKKQPDEQQLAPRETIQNQYTASHATNKNHELPDDDDINSDAISTASTPSTVSTNSSKSYDPASDTNTSIPEITTNNQSSSNCINLKEWITSKGLLKEMPFTREYIDTNDNIFQNASTITKASKIFHSYYKINSSRHHNTNYQAEFKGKTFKEVCAHLNAALLVTYKAHGIRPLKNSSPSVLIASTRTKIDPKINREMLPHPIWKHIKGTQSYLINQKAHELWNVLRMDSFYKQLSDEDYRTMNPAKKNCKL